MAACLECTHGSGESALTVVQRFNDSSNRGNMPGADCSYLWRLTVGFASSTVLVIVLLPLVLLTGSRRRKARRAVRDASRSRLSINGAARPSHGEGHLYEMLSSLRSDHAYASVKLKEEREEPISKQTDARVSLRNIRFHSQISPIANTGFGRMWKGEIRGVPGMEKKRILASIRDLTGISGVEPHLLQTVSLLWKLPYHENVVKCLGCCPRQKFIINEYVPNGTLLTYLQTNAGRKSRASYAAYSNIKSTERRIKEPEILRFAWQIANGMQFLTSRGIVHGKLRAGNILLTEMNICKLADYGLNEITPKDERVHRWMSPETMKDGAFAVNGDVWSYGIVLWELVTLGAQPYPGIPDDQLQSHVCGARQPMRRPRHCAEELFNIMLVCWRKEPRQRASFTALLNKLDRLLESSTDYLALDEMDYQDIYTNDHPDGS